jgi:3-deoxy-D-manno-octulosonic-acid transferase
MAFSLVLWLHLLTLPRFAAAAPALPAPARPDGRLMVLHISCIEARPGAMALARAVQRAQPDIAVLLTGPGVDPGPGGGVAEGLPPGVLHAAMPRNTRAAARRFLAHWRPDVVVLTGTPSGTALPTALIVQTHADGKPLLLADARFGSAYTQPWHPPGRWHRSLLRASLRLMRKILLQDQPSAAWLRRLGLPPGPLQVLGAMLESHDPLPCTEAERAALAAQLQSRPIWFAVAVPEAEEQAVLAAHDLALHQAHRMLLILAPANPDRAPALAALIEQQGFIVARRALEQEPEDQVQVLLVEDPAELGLWYRLAPVSWMGGTLEPGGADHRSPFEAAALGSAILHGPRTAPYQAEFARLSDARATRTVATPLALGDAVVELIAPDKVAALAHNAWDVTLGSSDTAGRAATAVLAEIGTAETGAA